MAAVGGELKEKKRGFESHSHPFPHGGDLCIQMCTDVNRCVYVCMCEHRGLCFCHVCFRFVVLRVFVSHRLDQVVVCCGMVMWRALCALCASCCPAIFQQKIFHFLKQSTHV